MSILGNRVARSEDPRFITGTATFGDDVKAQGALHATFVRSILPARPDHGHRHERRVRDPRRARVHRRGHRRSTRSRSRCRVSRSRCRDR